MVHRFLPALALLAALAACQTGGALGPIVSGSNHDIAAVRLALPAVGPGPITVSVTDQRPYVVNGEESAEFVGTERAAWSQTVKIKTESGRAFAEDLADVIAGALTQAGAEATSLPLPRGTSEAEVLAAFQAQGGARLLAVRMLEWRTDSYTRVIMKWGFEAAVYDPAGKVVGRSRSRGAAPVGSTVASEDGNMITQRELTRQLTNLLDDPAITRALR